jgi:hypothetical protein
VTGRGFGLSVLGNAGSLGFVEGMVMEIEDDGGLGGIDEESSLVLEEECLSLIFEEFV